MTCTRALAPWRGRQGCLWGLPGDLTIKGVEKRLLKKKAAKKHGVEYVDMLDDQIQVVRYDSEQFLRVRLDKSGWKDSQIIIVESDEGSSPRTGSTYFLARVSTHRQPEKYSVSLRKMSR